MPIIEPAEDNATLAQGDILELPCGGVALDASFNPSIMEDTRFGLVLSRDCAGAHGTSIVIAELVKTKLPFQTKKDESAEDSFDRLLEVLENARDGGATPDSFYVGSFRGDENRYYARFDRIISIRPPSKTIEREAWVTRHRKYRLTAEFRRSLPTRIYWALCRAGFDDHAWFSDVDRSVVVTAGDSFLAELEAPLKKAESDLKLLIEFGSANKQELEKRTKDVENLRKKVEAARQKIGPYRP